MANVTISQFKELWNINPEFNDPSHDFDNTYGYLCGTIDMGYITPDGKTVTFQLIFERYKTYHHVKTIANEGVEEKFRKKENKILPIFEYLEKKLFMSEIKIPQVGMHFYFWDVLTKDEVVKHFNIFKKLCERKAE
jgi:hypothetical protein